MQDDAFVTQSLRDSRILRTLGHAFAAVDPYMLVSQYLKENALPSHNRLFLLGIGKAAQAMTWAAAARYRYAGALVITKRALSVLPASWGQPSTTGAGATRAVSIRVVEAGHPIPDARSLAAGRAVLKFVAQLRSDDLLLCLVSGGGSALVAAPPAGVSLGELQALTDALLRSGATIDEVNVLRRRLDTLKGGRLAASTRAPIVSLILSDVIGDALEAIASGPTAPETTSPSEALEILRRRGIQPSESIAHALGRSGNFEPPPCVQHVQNVVLANNRTALDAAVKYARQNGLHSEITAAAVQGEAREAGRRLAAILGETVAKAGRPFCLLAGGETTVTLGAAGKGGRNQELALAAVESLSGLPDTMLLAVATDGEDGPTDAAGAVVTGETRDRASILGMSAADYLSRHDSYPFFNALDDLLRPGYTGTNVNDLMLLVAF